MAMTRGVVLGWAVWGLALAARGDLPPENAVRPVEVIRTDDYSEGVVVDHDGNLYFSHGKIITKMKPDGSGATTWAETGAPNGHKILADGTHLVCDASRHAVLRLLPDGSLAGAASERSDGGPLRGPNDLTLDTAHGGFYFTDPGGSDENRRIGTVHYVDAQGITHTVAEGLAFPNGIALRPDGKELLVGESKRNRILAYRVMAPGKLGPMRVLIDLPANPSGKAEDNQPDGIGLDAAGNLYVAHYGMRTVQVVAPDGKLLRSYPGGNRTTSNVAFGGPNHDQLFVTGGDPGAVFRLDLGAPGLVILPAKAR
jgi:gluconolactonase